MVPMLVYAYNCTRGTATGSSPYYLMYDQKPQLLVDLYFGTKKADMNGATNTNWLAGVPTMAISSSWSPSCMPFQLSHLPQFPQALK